jgi:hypothetical protein
MEFNRIAAVAEQVSVPHSRRKTKERAAQSEFNILVGMSTRPIRKDHDAADSRNSPFAIHA